jgi:hypothetical protein
MKVLFALLALSISTSAVAAPIYKKKFKEGDDEKIEERVLETIKEAVNASSNNKLKALVAKIRKDVDGSGSVGDPQAGDMLQIYHGKGSASEYGGTYLVGIPVSMQGTGMIEQHDGYVRVGYTHNMAEGELTVTIESIVKLVDQK